MTWTKKYDENLKTLMLLIVSLFTLTTSAATVDASTQLLNSQIEPIQVQNESANIATSQDSGFTLQQALSRELTTTTGSFFL